MEDFVRPQDLICRWTDWPKLQRDEKLESDLVVSLQDKEVPNSVKILAAELVFMASGELSGFSDVSGYYTTIEPDIVERFAARANVTNRSWTSKPCFKGRDGLLRIPFQLLVELAVAFSAAEPESVNLYVDMEESKDIAECLRPGRESHFQFMLQYKPPSALARQWAGGSANRDYLREEIRRLKEVGIQAAGMLRAADLVGDARQIERAILGQPKA